MVTHDEIWHLPAGVWNLREGRFDVERLNPPLTRMWSAIPLVAGQVSVDQRVIGTDMGKQFVEDHPTNFLYWYQWGRIFNIAWSLATGVLVFLWSRRLWGPVPGLVSLLLYVTCPNIVAHASLVTPDLGGTFGFVSTLFVVTWWCERPAWDRVIIWGVLLGMAEAAKFTSLLLYPLILAMTWISLSRQSTKAGIGWKSICLQLIAGFAISMIILASFYRFHGLFSPLASYQFQSIELVTIQKLFSSFSWLPVPLPADYLLGVDAQRFIMSGEHPIFLDGHWSLHGFRSYFIKALLYKLPHVFQLLLLLAVVQWIRGHLFAGHWRQLVVLLLPVGLILVVASGETLQLGVRYILPALPFLMIIAGGSTFALEKVSRRIQWASGIILLVACSLSLRFQPDHLAYFNEWAGGPIGGREHLIDSNLDWGQDLNELAAELKEQGIDSIGLVYFGTIPPSILGIHYELPPSRQPRPGTYAVSVNFVMGRPHSVMLADGTSRSVDFQEFGYFRFFRPVKTLGGSIDLYQINEQDVGDWNRAVQAARTAR